MGAETSRGERAMSEFIMRMMTANDVPQVEAIEKEAYRDRWSDFAYLSELKDNKLAYYVVLAPKEDESKVAAYGGFWAILDEGHITKVTVSREYRGKKLSKQLLLGMLKLAKLKGAVRVTLEVRVSNKAAIGLYHKMGFTDSGVRPHYYTDNNEDAYIMWRELDDIEVGE